MNEPRAASDRIHRRSGRRSQPGRGSGRISVPTYNERVSPSRRRRTGDPSLDDAMAAAAQPVGAASASLALAPAPPEERDWMRVGPVASPDDPAAPVPVADPAAVEQRRRDRA